MEDAPMEWPADPVDDKKKSFDKIVQTRAQKQKQQSGNSILKNSHMFKKDEYESNLAKIMEDQ
mgnify:FL=1